MMAKWEGQDDNDPACGRGWVSLGPAGRLVGHFYISSANAPDFFSDLLVLLSQKAASCGRGSEA
jgi:hypothetical protein